MRPGLSVPLAIVAVASTATADPLDERARAPAERVEMAPASDGSLGAWLVLGPFPSATHGDRAPTNPADALTLPPPALRERGIDESALLASSAPGAQPWSIASASDGPIDLKAALKAKGGDLVGYAAGVLHVEKAGRYLLLVGADDGLRVFVDGKTLLSREESRPQRSDDDLVPLDLGAGDHTVVLKLHQRDAGWSFKVRLLDDALEAPEGAYLALPGTSGEDARALAAKLSWVSVDRGLDPAGADGAYHPRLTVRFPEGAPRGVPLRTTVRLVETHDRSLRMDVDAGEVPLDARGAGELVVTLPSVDEQDLPVDDHSLAYEVSVAGRFVKAPWSPRRRVHDAVLHAARALAACDASGAAASWLPSGSRDSVLYLRDRLASLASHGDGDLEAELDEATELDALAADLDRKVDPYARRTGPMRRALLAPYDGKPAPFGLYVPASYRPGGARRYPLLVGLHGLNGRAMAMIRYLFGNDDPRKPNEWEDRHLGPLPPLDAFVLTPSGYGNTMYRDLGEDDTLRLVAWAESRYPIDPDRVTITGMSMGGIGSAAIPLHHPGIFAAAEPLCGYHSYFVRRDIAGHPLRPWEKLLAEERSNVSWAVNGAELPLYIVHGTLDLPQDNSGVLIKRYEELGYDVVHEHPALGHNVWQTTYEDLKGAKWLLRHRKAAVPRRVRFRTIRLRDGDDAWVHVTELERPDAWGEVDARASSHALAVTTSGVSALRFDREAAVGLGPGAVKVRIDGSEVLFDAGAELALHQDGGRWKAGDASHDRPWKRGALTGPIRDVFHEPLLFVYGASDPAEARADEEVARQWAAMRGGVSVDYPILSDQEFLAGKEPLGNDRALFLVGSPKGNAVLRALDPKLPIHIEGDAVVTPDGRFDGPEAGAAFVWPNPARPDRYLVVVEAASAAGIWRSLSLPDLIPDFVVYDRGVAAARGQMILGPASVRAAGFFEEDWSYPRGASDPLAQSPKAAAKSEYEATPYLP